MKVLFSDGRLLERGGRLHLVRLSDAWYVLGDGYVCQVETCEEGVSLIVRFESAGRRRSVVIGLGGHAATDC